ncbi:MAG: thioesterase family protein [Gammaproteobacteria bacterium]|nr:thioesterase family protein [Gammaproteobacteria bacterium]
MAVTVPSEEELARIYANVREIFERIPFNHQLGLEIELIEIGYARLRLPMRDELVGNYVRDVLHGGVISATLDVTCGLVAFVGVATSLEGVDMEKKLELFSRLGTIDMRVDYLRPGTGRAFVASACTVRAGKRIAVIRGELHDEAEELVASAVCTYLIG